MPFADLGTHRLHYTVDGPEDAPVLMLSHSLGSSTVMWAPQAAAFAERFRVLRYDTRGHGASDAPDGAYTMDELGEDALRLLDLLGIERAHFCGLSMGGATGQWLGSHAPERLDKLVLCNTGAKIGDDALWNGRIAAVRDDGVASLGQAMMARWFTADFHARDPACVARIRAIFDATPPAGYAGCCAALRDADFTAVLEDVAVPTLVVAGTHDPATPPALGRILQARIPAARYVELPAAHLSNLEATEAFNAAVAAFLS